MKGWGRAALWTVFGLVVGIALSMGVAAIADPGEDQPSPGVTISVPSPDPPEATRSDQPSRSPKPTRSPTQTTSPSDRPSSSSSDASTASPSDHDDDEDEHEDEDD